MNLSTLYLCYFGLREPLVQTQVLPYLRQLAASGIKVHLLTFEPRLRESWNETDIRKETEQLEAEGIKWFRLPYHKSPSVPGTAYDILAGARFAIKLAKRLGVDVLHARAHVPLAMALLAAKRLPGVRIIFDIRGLMAEEYEDAGVWRRDSNVFRAVKKLERRGIERADGIVVLTQRMRQWLVDEKLASADKIQVIPCCVDIALYRGTAEQPAPARETVAGRFEVVYAGSVTGLYMLEEMGRFFKALRAKQSSAFFRVLTMSSAVQATEVLRRVGLSDEDFQVVGVSAAEVPELLRRAKLGISFRKPTFAQIAASPTKIPEYLAAGLPVVCNGGIGDMDELVENERVGIVMCNFDEAAYQTAAEQALGLVNEVGVNERCRRVARAHFDLHTIGGNQYVELYRRLGK